MAGHTKLQNEYTDVICLTDIDLMKMEASRRLAPLLEGISEDEFLDSVKPIRDLTALRHAISDLVIQHRKVMSTT